MLTTTTEVYRPRLDDFELAPFLARVLDIVRLFEDASLVRLRVHGTIAAGEPIEALDVDEIVEVHSPLHRAGRHRAALRRCLCSALERGASDAFEIARVLTPVLAALKLSGHAPAEVDLDPWLFAGAALLIARVGVAAFCADDRDEGEGEEDAPATGHGASSSPPPLGARPARAP